jgi:uncharacterized membrane protein
MLSQWKWILSQLTRTLWVRASLFAVLAIITALIAIPLERYFELTLGFEIEADSVKSILNILASSMLAVTTFSLSIMVSAYSAASSTVSPRATKLVQQDSTTQNVLATFIGSFLYSLVGIIALSSHVYGNTGRIILFMVTLLVVMIIVITILRWIEHLSKLGRLGETTDQLEKATTRAIKERLDYPYLNAKSLDLANLPSYKNNQVFHTEIGYIQHVDIQALNVCAQSFAAEVALLVLPGEFIHLNSVIACTDTKDDELTQRIRSVFTIANERSFDQDPGFGVVVLSEIASRALSPAVNDPGTALDIINRSIRILSTLAHYVPSEIVDTDSVVYSNVLVPELPLNQLFSDMYLPIARDGAAIFEVQESLQQAFLALRAINNSAFNKQLTELSDMANQFAQSGLVLDTHKQIIDNLSLNIKDY